MNGSETGGNPSLFSAGNVAVVTGAASGIGRAAAETFAGKGMNIVLFDRDEELLAEVGRSFGPDVRTLAGDVSSFDDLVRLRDLAIDAFGRVDVLVNNAAISGAGSDNWAGLDAWRRIIDVNMWGVIHGVHAFVPAMSGQGTRAAIINLGSKQGITNPPGQPAYAVAKAAVKTLTEQLAHGLRQEGSAVTAHLLVPGWTWTRLTGAGSGTKPDGAWTAEQVVDRMMRQVDAGDFYIICPDNSVSPELDAARIQWAAGDITENRPALSRWHPDWTASFDAWIVEKTSPSEPA